LSNEGGVMSESEKFKEQVEKNIEGLVADKD